MKIVILDSLTLGNDINMEPLYDLGKIITYEETLSDQIEEHIKDADIVITNKCSLNRQNMKNAEKLKLICVTATGVDKIDTLFCKENNITVCNVPSYSTDSVVQLTLAMVLSLSTRLKEYNSYVSNGSYSKGTSGNFLGYQWSEIKGKTWGILGGGAIGQKVASFAKLLGCNVLIFRRKKDKVYENADIERLLRESDIITVHLPLNDETRNIINKDRIAMMKKNVIFVNTSRGAVTDEVALAEAIENNQIGAFASDVYSTEPFSIEHAYSKICHKDNVLLTPHIAWSAIESRNRCIFEVGENIKAFLKGEKRNAIV